MVDARAPAHSDRRGDDRSENPPAARTGRM